MVHPNAPKILKAIFSGLVAVCMIAFCAVAARAELKSSQARKLITRMAGFELTSGSVRVKSIASSNPTTADLTAEIRTVFKFAQDNRGAWRVAEVRTGPGRWEEVSLIASALHSDSIVSDCTAPDPPFRGGALLDPSFKRARCLVGGLLGINVPSDAVRIQEISPMGIPLASQSSAVVVAWISIDARLVNDSKAGWRVTELRTGQRDWVSLDRVVARINELKQQKTRAELRTIATALEKFRADRGSYVVADNQAAVIDHLSPRYLTTIIREDPWHQPYKYEGERNRFRLRSAGPDGKDDTADDILVSNQ